MVWNEKKTVNVKIKVVKIAISIKLLCAVPIFSFPKMHGSSSGNAEMVYLLVSGCIFHTLEGEGFVEGVLVARYGQTLIPNTPCDWYIYLH